MKKRPNEKPGIGSQEEVWLESLLNRTDEEMRLRNFSPRTRSLYRGHLRRFYEARGGTRAECTSEECRQWLLSLLDRGLSHSYVGQARSALKFVHESVLKRPAPVATFTRPRQARHLPTVLNRSEVRRLIQALRNPKERAIVTLLYSAGLRVGEAVRLRVADIDLERKVIHVRNGKGQKDRVVMLAQVAEKELRNYRTQLQPL